MERELQALLAGPRQRAATLRGMDYTLRVVTARELLEARREADGLAADGAERALCANACLLARALELDGRRLFPSGEAALAQLTPGEIGSLAAQLGQLEQAGDPSVEDGAEETQRLKKA